MGTPRYRDGTGSHDKKGLGVHQIYRVNTVQLETCKVHAQALSNVAIPSA